MRESTDARVTDACTCARAHNREPGDGDAQAEVSQPPGANAVLSTLQILTQPRFLINL